MKNFNANEVADILDGGGPRSARFYNKVLRFEENHTCVCLALVLCT